MGAFLVCGFLRCCVYRYSELVGAHTNGPQDLLWIEGPILLSQIPLQSYTPNMHPKLALPPCLDHDRAPGLSQMDTELWESQRMLREDHKSTSRKH